MVSSEYLLNCVDELDPKIVCHLKITYVDTLGSCRSQGRTRHSSVLHNSPYRDTGLSPRLHIQALHSRQAYKPRKQLFFKQG